MYVMQPVFSMLEVKGTADHYSKIQHGCLSNEEMRKEEKQAFFRGKMLVLTEVSGKEGEIL